jgi:hypothetical protein
MDNLARPACSLLRYSRIGTTGLPWRWASKRPDADSILPHSSSTWPWPVPAGFNVWFGRRRLACGPGPFHLRTLQCGSRGQDWFFSRHNQCHIAGSVKHIEEFAFWVAECPSRYTVKPGPRRAPSESTPPCWADLRSGGGRPPPPVTPLRRTTNSLPCRIMQRQSAACVVSPVALRLG